MKSFKKHPRKKGSILLVTMILALALAVFVGSFIKLAMGSYRLSQRSFFSNSTLNLAEAGLEEAIYALNNADWSGWTASGGDMVRTITGLPIATNRTGQIKVKVFNYATSTQPRIVAEGLADIGSGPPITKQIEAKVGKKSFWANGMVAKDTVEFKGGVASVDSYDSSDPTYSTGGLYDPLKNKDNGSVGSTAVTTDAVSISNSDIWGTVSTAGTAPSVGPTGSIMGLDTPSGITVDPNRIRTDFKANFDLPDSPTSFTYTYGAAVSGAATFGTTGTTNSFRLPSLDNSNGDVTSIYGDVTLLVTGDIEIKGEIFIDANASLTVYVEGDVDIGGNGLINTSQIPANTIIYGISTTTQTINLNGNAALHAAVYAPNAEVELKGGGGSGEFTGSVVAATVFVNGTYDFHYDEALADLATSKVYTVSLWRELANASEREAL